MKPYFWIAVVAACAGTFFAARAVRVATLPDLPAMAEGWDWSPEPSNEVEKPSVRPVVAAPKPPTPPGGASLLPEGIDLREADASLSAVARHFLKQASADPDGFSGLIARNAARMSPRLLEVAVWALGSVDTGAAVAAMDAIATPSVRRLVAPALARTLPPDRHSEVAAICDRLKLGMWTSRMILAAARRWDAADPEAIWAVLRGGAAEPGVRSAALKALGRDDPELVKEVCRDPEKFGISRAGIAWVVADAVIADPTRAASLVGSIADPGTRSLAVATILRNAENTVVGEREFEILSQLVPGAKTGERGSSWNDRNAFDSLVAVAIANFPDKAIALAERYAETAGYRIPSAKLAEGLFGDDPETAFHWLTDSLRKSSPAGTEDPEDSAFGHWIARDADSLTEWLAGGNGGEKTGEVLRKIEWRVKRHGEAAAEAWRASLPPSLRATLEKPQ